MTEIKSDARLVVRVDWTARQVRNATTAKLPAGPMWPEHGLSERARATGRAAAEALWAALGGASVHDLAELARKDLWEAARDQRVDNRAAFEQSWPGLTSWLADAATAAGCPAADLWLEHLLDGFWGCVYSKPNPTGGHACVRGGRHTELVRRAQSVHLAGRSERAIVSIEVHQPPTGATGPIFGGFTPDAGVGGIDGRKVGPALR